MITKLKPLSWSSVSPWGQRCCLVLKVPPVQVYPEPAWPQQVRAHGCPCQATLIPWATPHPHLPDALKTPVLSSWHTGLPPSCKCQVCCPHHMSPAPGRGSFRPKLGLTRKWLRSQKAEGPLARTQISHKIWILPYWKLKPQQQNINQARENRKYLLPEKPSCGSLDKTSV